MIYESGTLILSLSCDVLATRNRIFELLSRYFEVGTTREEIWLANLIDSYYNDNNVIIIHFIYIALFKRQALCKCYRDMKPGNT